MTGRIYNDRPEGVRFRAEWIADPGRGKIENEIWDWGVRSEDDPDEFVDFLDDDEQRHRHRRGAQGGVRQGVWLLGGRSSVGGVRCGATSPAPLISRSSACWPGRTSPAVAPARPHRNRRVCEIGGAGRFPRSTTSGTTPGTGTDTSGTTSRTPSQPCQGHLHDIWPGQPRAYPSARCAVPAPPGPSAPSVRVPTGRGLRADVAAAVPRPPWPGRRAGCQSPGIVEGVVMRPGPPGRGAPIVGSRWANRQSQTECRHGRRDHMPYSSAARIRR
ncbi:hypothetical protein JD77_05945 [Micromonospora olivasterospora]|uniref:Uncharacterized protein n=1 Tax=Micromonospora olivasterospora TaxID=1880 RepID=A0A562IJ14_MICOL|nr:hypothetical protein JD77_05945 [Micromonospora olivasterospora]